MRRPRLFFALVAAVAAAVGISLEARDQRVSFRTSDGVTISAAWFEPSVRPAPAVLLVHMLGRSRRDWDSLASRLAGSG
ncbi:MAG: hypothetical protein M3541_09225, partial [Acidobacteriota bacterium]|nr:hypothetical protein [Acidobacteriota bacterium]